MKKETIATVDDYIGKFEGETRKRLEQMRAAILKAAPGAEEYIGYQMPAYKLNGPLVYFAGYKAHIGFYPMPGALQQAFAAELKPYPTSKGAVQFPLDQKLPLALVTKMVKFRVKQNLEKPYTKKAATKKNTATKKTALKKTGGRKKS